ncbi:hypothetical protein LTR50_007104 [Elasticomyces elasticus]|nr:hypothetical protein LTR50_007104 [Elasticomyces elasticus]
MPLQKWKSPEAGDLSGEARAEVVTFLQRFGHLESRENVESEDLTSALETFQYSNGLLKTGTYDKATAELIQQPRCGYPDRDPAKPQEFTLSGGKWDHTDVTYRFDSFSLDLTQQQIRQVIAGAFAKWASITPLTFREVLAGTSADVRIRFASGNHGDGVPFDGPGSVLAHAWGPGNGDANIAGDAHFDEDEAWTVDYLGKVALHEFGHTIGLGHSAIASAVMYAFFNNQPSLQPDDISGAQGLYGPRKVGWFNFELANGPTIAAGADIAALSRISDSMEVWWIAPNGSVQGAYWYGNGNSGWQKYELAPAGSAVAGGITAVSRIPRSMEVWWIGREGSVEGAFWYEGQHWGRYTLAPPGSAAVGTRITAVSRVSNSMEVWWIAPNGSVQDAYWYEGAAWQRFQLAPPNSAAVGGIKAISRIADSMEVWWVAPNGSIQDAYWYSRSGWNRVELAPAGSAATGTSIAAVRRIPTSMEVWWVAPNGSVQDAYWYEGVGWNKWELAPAGSAQRGGIEAVSRIPNSMEVWWAASDGSIQDAYWYANNGWKRFQLAPPSSAAPGSEFAVTSRIQNSMEIWFSGPSGSLVDYYWYG